MDFLEWIVELGLRSWPPTTRSRFGEDLARDVLERYRQSRAQGRWRAVARFFADLIDLAGSGFLQRLKVPAPLRAAPAFFRGPRSSQHPNQRKGSRSMSGFLFGLRAALRTLVRRPALALLVIGMVAGGIAINTTMWSLVSSILLRPLAFRDAGRLVFVFQTDRFNETQRESSSGPDYFDYLARQRSMQSLGAVAQSSPTLQPADGEPRRVVARHATASLLFTLGIEPALGRLFTEEEDHENGPRVVVLDHAFWERSFGADSRVVGSSIRLDGVAHTVLGVLAPRRGTQLRANIWLPLQYGPSTNSRGVHNLTVVGRLAEGVDLPGAQADFSRIMTDLEREYAEDNEGRGAHLEPMRAYFTGGARTALLVLVSAVGLVLLLACANVANILLAAGSGRANEMAMRAALGASRARLIRQLLTETFVLVVTGGALGILGGYGVLRWLRGLDNVPLPRLDEVRLDGRSVAIAVALAVVTGLLAGVVPALRLSRAAAATRGAVDARRSGSRLAGTLAVFQVAIACALTLVAGLLLRTLGNLSAVEPGFRAEGLVKLSLQLPEAKYPSDFRSWPSAPEVKQFQRELLEKAAAVPVISSVALAVNHPLNPGWTSQVTVEGGPTSLAEGLEEERIRPVSTGYFHSAGIPLLRGRDFTDRDEVGLPVVIVNSAFARKYFAADEPLGKNAAFWGQAREIVGVVGDVRFFGPRQPSEPAVYAPLGQLPFSSFDVVAYAPSRPGPALAALQGIVNEMDPDLAPFGAARFTDLLAETGGSEQFNARLLVTFAGLALVLAAVGIYGLISQGVSQRVPELGLRLCLGARPSELGLLILRWACFITGCGLVLGAGLALLLARGFSSLLFGVEVTDVWTLAGVTVVLFSAAIVAALRPAWRAVRVDPVTALRG